MNKYKELDKLQQKVRFLIEQKKFEEAEEYRKKASSLIKELYNFTTLRV